MKIQRLLFCAPLALCLAVGCSTDHPDVLSSPTLPVFEKGSDLLTIETIPWDGNFIADPCSDELLVCSGAMEYRTQWTFDGSGNWHLTCHMMSEDFVATNLRTGTSYRIAESSMYSAEVRPPYPILTTQTIKVMMKGSDGSRFRMHLTVHITLDGQGEVRVTSVETAGICA